MRGGWSSPTPYTPMDGENKAITTKKKKKKVFSACISSALLYGSETWAPTAPDLQRLHRNDRAMIHWICGVKPHDEVPMETLYTKLGIQEVAVALRTKCLRWYGHVTRASSWTNSITSISIPRPSGRGRPRTS